MVEQIIESSVSDQSVLYCINLISEKVKSLGKHNKNGLYTEVVNFLTKFAESDGKSSLSESFIKYIFDNNKFNSVAKNNIIKLLFGIKYNHIIEKRYSVSGQINIDQLVRNVVNDIEKFDVDIVESTEETENVETDNFVNGINVDAFNSFINRNILFLIYVIDNESMFVVHDNAEISNNSLCAKHVNLFEEIKTFLLTFRQNRRAIQLPEFEQKDYQMVAKKLISELYDLADACRDLKNKLNPSTYDTIRLLFSNIVGDISVLFDIYDNEVARIIVENGIRCV